MRGGWSTLVLVAAALGLGAYIYFVDSKRPDTEAKAKVFVVDAADIEEVRVVAKGETSLVRKTDGAWTMVEPIGTDVDQGEATALVNGLASLELNREVEPNATNLAEFGLASPKADITFTAKGGVSGRIRLGDITPTSGDLYALRDDETRVFLVDTFTENVLARSSFDLRDKRVLRFERDKADGLEITTPEGTATLARTNSQWRVTGGPSNGRGDYGAIEGLLTRLSTAVMASITAAEVTDPAMYGLDKPSATVVVRAGSSAATLALGASVAGKTFARDLSRAIVFTVDDSFAAELHKGASDYRKKEVFDFRGFSATQLVLTRGARTVTLQKVKGTGENAVDKWQITVSGEGAAAGRDAEAANVDELLSELSALRAGSFVPAGPGTGLASPLLTVTAAFDENGKEEVTFARAGSDVFAARADESGAMKLEAAPFDAALKALDAVVTPPAPAASTPATGTPPEKRP